MNKRNDVMPRVLMLTAICFASVGLGMIAAEWLFLVYMRVIG